METKNCKTCGATKPLAEFYPNAKGRNGVSAHCKPCQRAKIYAGQLKPREPAANGERRCSCCKETKPLAEFGNNKMYHDGLSPVCRGCGAARHDKWRKANMAYANEQQKKRYRQDPARWAEYERKSHYGLEHGTYATMLEQQGGRCAICLTDDPAPRKHFAVDHCHETGAVRALLCGRCNTGIGQMRHSKVILLAAINYLEKYPSNHPKTPELDTELSMRQPNC